jgi:hypothetical protein
MAYKPYSYRIYRIRPRDCDAMRIEWNRRALALVLLLMLASVVNATIDGRIKEVTWGMSGETVPIIVKR